MQSIKLLRRVPNISASVVTFVAAALLCSARAHSTPTVFIASDSTAAQYGPERYPQMGWGMVLHCAFDANVDVKNYAKGGRSSKSFITQGLFAAIEREMEPGDTLLIQFGHNDAKADDPVRYTEAATDYKFWLRRYVAVARAKGAQPIFITPVARRVFKDAALIDTHSAYANAMRETAIETGTPLIDLTMDSMRWLNDLGPQAAKRYYLVFEKEEGVRRFPDGYEDNTHFTELGARKVANLVAEKIARLKLPLSKHVLKTRAALTSDHALGSPSCRSTVPQQPDPLTAFPGAEGAGRYAQGGRGGAVLKVTNLNDAGPGSLRDAIEAVGPRIVVFDVSGTIALQRPLRIREGRITIAGQTAPGDGITLRNYTLHVAADDVVIRYIRSRLGDESGEQDDAISVDEGHRIVLDHVSASWSVDETLSVSADYQKIKRGLSDVTVQWSLIAESLNKSKHDKGAHGYGTLTRGGRGSTFSFHHNLWASHQARMPRPGNYTSKEFDSLGAFFDFRNNVFYNWGGESAGYNADTESLAAYNFIANAYVTGPNSKGSAAFKESNRHARAYFAGNTLNGVLPNDPWTLVIGEVTPDYKLKSAIDTPPVSTDSAADAFQKVLRDAGASLYRDDVDRRVVSGVKSRSHRIIDSQRDVGGWPSLYAAPPRKDSDGDGMPDDWERARGFDAEKADGNNDVDGNGYSNLEDYLNELATPRAPASIPRPSGNERITVTSTARVYPTLQSAVDALPDSGGEITLASGVYREKVTIDKPNVRLQGVGAKPADVVIVWGDANATVGGTIKSATLTVTGDRFQADNLSVQNDFSLQSTVQSQAVALAITSDRAVVSRVRLLGAQDTLYAGTKRCESDVCPPSRQYFRDCYIEGHVDFIFGDAKAYFAGCEIHAIAHDEVMLTAHSRTATNQDRAYVFDGCRITADDEARTIYFGRPWRDYAAVIFLNTSIDARIHPAGWREWTPGQTQRLQTAYYAEYRSAGRGGEMSRRDPHAHVLSAADAQRWSLDQFFANDMSWLPTARR